MNTGVVYPAGYEGHPHLEVAFRGERQLLPGGSLTFLSEKEMVEAIKEVALANGWTLPRGEENFPFAQVWADVKQTIGWDYHPSNYREVVQPTEGSVMVVVYRHEVNSRITREQPSSLRRW